MTDTRHTTTLEIKAETRGVKDLGKEIKGAFDPKVLSAFEAGMSRMSSVMDHLVEQQQQLVELQKRGAQSHAAGTAAIVSAIAGRGAGDKEERERRRTEAAENKARRDEERDAKNSAQMRRRMGHGVGNFAGGVSNMGAAAMGGPGLAEGMLSMIPYVGPGLAGVVSALRMYSGMAEGFGSALGGAFGSTGMSHLGGGMSEQFARYGLSNIDAPGMLAQFAGATGLRGEGLRAVAPMLLDMQRGMGLGSAGNIIRANATGGGSAGSDTATKATKDAIAAGMMAGIRDGRLDEYLAAIASHTEAARTEGVDLSTEALTTLVQGFAARGLSGERATSAATSAASALRNLGEDTSFGSQVALRLAMAGDERTGGSGPRTYEEALAFMENNPEVMTRAMMQQAEELSGGDRSVLAGNLRRLGLGFGRNQSMRMATATLNPNRRDAFRGVDDDARGFLDEALEANTEDARRAAGASVHRAGLTNSGIGIGGGPAGGALRRLEGVEMGVAQQMAPIVAGPVQALADTSREMLDSFNRAGGGTEGMTAILRDVIGPIFARSLEQATGSVESSLAPTGDILTGGQSAVTGGRTDFPVQLERAFHNALLSGLRSFFGVSGENIGRAIIHLSRLTSGVPGY